MAKNCTPNSVDCKGHECPKCADCAVNTVLKAISETQPKLETCEKQITALEQSKLADTKTTSSLKEKHNILVSQIAQIKQTLESTKQSSAEQKSSLQSQMAGTSKTANQLIQEAKSANRKIKAKIEALSTQLTTIKSQLKDTNKTYAENKQKLEAAKACFEAMKQLEIKRKVLTELKSTLKQVKSALEIATQQKQKTSHLPGSFEDEKCQKRYKDAENRYIASFKTLQTTQKQLETVSNEFVTAGKKAYGFCNLSKIDYIKQLEEFDNVKFDKKNSKGPSDTCQGWQGSNGKHVQEAKYGIPKKYWVWPDEKCWNPIIRRCVKGDPQYNKNEPENLKSLVNNLKLTDSEKALIQQRISLGLSKFKEKYKGEEKQEKKQENKGEGEKQEEKRQEKKQEEKKQEKKQEEKKQEKTKQESEATKFTQVSCEGFSKGKWVNLYNNIPDSILKRSDVKSWPKEKFKRCCIDTAGWKNDYGENQHKTEVEKKGGKWMGDSNAYWGCWL
jgi:hypothetical protein